MKFLLDENLPYALGETLEKIGLTSVHVHDVDLRGATDAKIATYAKKHNAVLITRDLEFGSLLMYPRGSHYGLIIVRLPHHFTTEALVRNLRLFFEQVKPTQCAGKMIILELGKYRIRDIIKRQD